jgi:hypothetical protein
MQVCKTYDGSPPEVGIAELRGCVELAQRLRVNLEIHGVRDSNGICRWYEVAPNRRTAAGLSLARLLSSRQLPRARSARVGLVGR